MKKLQCEICGSIEIKKIAEDLYACESCGVRYSMAQVRSLLVEVEGAVQIDHTAEATNAVKRGIQYEAAGDIHRAEAYYNKALDLDADNADALRRAQEAAQIKELAEYYIAEPDVSPKQNVKDFLSELGEMKHIACDIYKQISITSVEEKYLLFLNMACKCRCDWSVTACRRYYENETIYETQYNSTLKRYVKEPVTKKVERISRSPASGNRVYECEDFIMPSEALKDTLPFADTELPGELLADFEQLQRKKYNPQYFTKLDLRKLKKDSDQYLYEGMPLQTDIDQSIFSRKKAEMLKQADQNTSDEIIKSLNCDFIESTSATRVMLSDVTSYILIPVQIIHYTYKGQSYVAVSDLLSHTDTASTIYPCDTELLNKQRNLKKDTEKTQSTKNLTYAGYAMFFLGILSVIYGTVIQYSDSLFFVYGALVLFFLSLCVLILSAVVKNRKLHQLENEALEFKRKRIDPKMADLKSSSEVFFREYTDYASAQQAAMAVQCISPDIVEPQLHRTLSLAALAENTQVEDSDIKILEAEIRQQKKKRKTAWIMAILGIGSMISGIWWETECLGPWYYSQWVLQKLTIFGGIAVGVVGAGILLIKQNKTISKLKKCLSACKSQWVEQPVTGAMDQKQANEILTDIKKKQVDSSKQQKKGRIKTKRVGLMVFGILVAVAIVLTVAEYISMERRARPYEEELHNKTFEYRSKDADSSRIDAETETYTFAEDGTYQYSREECRNGEMFHSGQKHGEYWIRFEVFSGTPYLLLNDGSCFELAYDDGNIKHFGIYNKWYWEPAPGKEQQPQTTKPSAEPLTTPPKESLEPYNIYDGYEAQAGPLVINFIEPEDLPRLGEYYWYPDGYDDTATLVAIAQGTVTEFSLKDAYVDDDLEWVVYDTSIFTQAVLEPGEIIAFKAEFAGLFSTCAIEFVDEQGTQHCYILDTSGEDGSLLLRKMR